MVDNTPDYQLHLVIQSSNAVVTRHVTEATKLEETLHHVLDCVLCSVVKQLQLCTSRDHCLLRAAA